MTSSASSRLASFHLCKHIVHLCEQRKLQVLLLMQVDVLEYYETSVRSASAQFLIPAVLRVRMYVSKRELKSGRLSLSRRNILLRDSGQCQCDLTPPSEVPLLMFLET